MNSPSKKTNFYIKPNNLKKVVAIWSLSLLALFNIPTILWAGEKYLQKNKIGKVPKYEYDIEQLFQQLWYHHDAQTLYVYDHNDIDLGHLNWSQETMENLYHQFWSIQEETQNDTISIPWTWTSYAQFNKSANHIKLEWIYNCNIIDKMEYTLHLNENEVIFILSFLMNLSLWEYVEQLQLEDWSVRNISASGYNIVDLKGNIAWVLTSIEYNNDWWITRSDITRILWVLQKRYNTIDGYDTLIWLSNEFDLWIQIKKR